VGQDSEAAADGSVVVGYSGTSSGGRAFRWSAADGVTDLGLFDGDGRSEAQATNADGSVVVGHSINTNNGQSRAFRWTAQDGKVQIGGHYTFALGISADGTIVVGLSDSYAYRWTQDVGVQSLGVLAAGTNSFAYDISADGTSEATDGRFAFRWTEQDQMVSLGVLDGGVESYAHADMFRDAYTENAEATVFNANFNSAKTSVTVAKLDVTGEWQFPDDHSLSIGAGANFDLNVADITLTGSSNISGLDTFIAPSPLSRHQVRPFVTASYSVNIGDSATFTASARAGRATFGDTPDLGIGLRYAVHF
jgi:probable HAF family extracellular repeat protein